MGTLSWIDYLIIIISVLGAVAIGMYFARRQKSSDKFFTGGRNIPSWAIGISIMSTLISSITFLAYPAMGYSSNWILLVQGIMVPIVLVFIIGFIVPLFRQVIGISAYEYFEKRFGIVARLYSSLAFSLMHFSKTGTVIFLLSLALSSVMGLDLLTTVWVLTLVVTFVTVLGGLEGVIWMDVFQGIWLMGGGLICIAFLLFLPDEGISEIFRVIGEAEKISFAPWDFDFSQLTVIVLVINGMFYAVQKYGTDQTIVQRYLAASSDKKAIRASFIGVLLSVPLWTMFMFIGTLLYAYYQLSPELLPEGMLAEGVFPYFIATELWVVLKGFIIAALIAAAISTISSDFNCLSAIGVTDFYERFKSKVTDAQKLKMGRIIIVASGVLAAFIGTLYVKWGGEGVLGVIFGLYAIFSAGIVGMFLLGLIVKRANTKGLYIGMIACVLFTAWGTLTTTEVNTEGIPGVLWDLGQFNFPHHTYMLGVYSHIVLFVFGWLGSYFFKPQPVAENLYIYEFLRRKKKDEL